MAANGKRLHRVCFTGHRPEKLTRPEWMIRSELESSIEHAVDDGLNVFISGMSRGVDLWAADIVLRLRDSGKPVRLICAIPFEGFENSWEQAWKRLYSKTMHSADFVKFVCPKYSHSCFQIRNEWMVDHSTKVIAVFNGEKGGTKNTIDYANIMGVDIEYIPG